MERSQWQISFSEGRAPLKCQNGLWDPDEDAETGSALLAEPLGTDSDGDVLEQVSSAPTSYLKACERFYLATQWTHQCLGSSLGVTPGIAVEHKPSPLCDTACQVKILRASAIQNAVPQDAQ